MKARKGVPPKSSTVSIFQCDRYALSADTSEMSKCLAGLFTSGTKEYGSWKGGRLFGARSQLVVQEESLV